MRLVTMWVDLENFELFRKEKPFVARDCAYGDRCIEVSIPVQKVVEVSKGLGGGVKFICK